MMDWLSAQQILASLDLGARNLLQIEVLETVCSTNDYLLQRLSELEKPTVCVARVQTAGKGRQGKKWDSPLGDLYLSLYWHIKQRADLSALSLLVALALLQGLKKLAPLPEVGIKWPNDIWQKDSKLGGILLESKTHKLSTKLVMGVGLNLVNQQYANLTTLWGKKVSIELVISAFLNQLIPMLQQFQTDGFQPFVRQWAQYDLLLGKQIVIKGEHFSQQGIAQGINEHGELCVKVGDRVEQLRYGQVSVQLL